MRLETLFYSLSYLFKTSLSLFLIIFILIPNFIRIEDPLRKQYVMTSTPEIPLCICNLFWYSHSFYIDALHSQFKSIWRPNVTD